MPLPHFVVEGHFQCIEAVFIVHTVSPFLRDFFATYSETLLKYRPDYGIGQGGREISI
jgi:hypothetical protein